eukprot:CAMPEP_0168358620 /NCGR_PEP_ID=MMETSP0228-20121227/1214_1 /TAXON_ID=133427 /ORGANISM="Protoceratium reticulatum, Strain CCCM 535 (=CCMP 1889)" /LENGTH=377 /DNA_ID=CAMNT_0008371211 /DNA_START=34 /DNA_END=1167 /DNA_ORIENTATION=-
MGWTIDDIVNPEAAKHAKQFECSICCSIWDDPVETTCCEHMFCRTCIGRCSSCPICRVPFGNSPVKECSKAVLRMLNTVDVHCPYQSSIIFDSRGSGANNSARDDAPAAKKLKLCADSGGGCEWKGSYGDLLSKHIGECPYCPVQCPRECGETVFRKDLDRHSEVCTKRFEKCAICGEQVQPGMMQDHKRRTAELHVQLLQDRLEEENSRADRRGVEMAILSDVLASVKALPASQQQHVTDITRRRADDIKDEVKRQLSRAAIWKIQDAARVMQTRTHLTSPQFSLSGYNLALEFYSRGHPQSEEGCSCVFLKSVPNSVQMHAKFTINGTVSRKDDDCRSGQGFVDWPRTEAIMKTIQDNTIMIKVEALEVAQLVTS